MNTIAMSRRRLLTTAIIGGAAAFTVSACADFSAIVTTFEAGWSQFATTVQTLVSQGASYIPTVESIAETMASLFGPAWQTAVTLGVTVLNQVVSALVSVVTTLTPPALSSMRGRLRGAIGPAASVIIGPLPGSNGKVVIQGYK